MSQHTANKPTTTTHPRRFPPKVLIPVTAVALACAGLAILDLPRSVAATTPEYVYVWAGVEGRNAPDRIVTLDYTEGSPTYGQMVSQTLIPDPGSEGNEPHHCGISMDAKTLACGGLLSALSGQNSVFLFNLNDPANPVFVKSFKTANADFPDDFVAMPDGTFLFTQMGAPDGGDGGRVARIDANGNLLGQWPADPPPDFNPHGIQVRSDINLMVTCDYVQPNSTLTSYPGPIQWRHSVRVWNLASMTITRTIELPDDAQTMDCRLIPGDPQGRGYVGGSGNGILYLFNSATGTAQPAFDLNAAVGGAVQTQYCSMAADGKHLYVPYLSASGYHDGIAVLDISDPTRPVMIQNIQLPYGAGPHMSMLVNHGTKLLGTDYFLNEDDLGRIHYEGDHFVRSYDVDPSTGLLTPDLRFQVDMNNVVPGLKLRPHGAEVSMPMDMDMSPSPTPTPPTPWPSGAPQQFSTASVSIVGTPRIGATLTAQVASAPTPDAIAYLWTRDGAAIAGTNLPTYVPQASDAGHQIGLQIAVAKSGYTTETATAQPVTIAWTVLGNASSAPPTTAAAIPSGQSFRATSLQIVGNRGTGATLTALVRTSPRPDAIAYQWTRNGVAIDGATAVTYVQQASDAGATIGVQATLTKSGYAPTVVSKP